MQKLSVVNKDTNVIAVTTVIPKVHQEDVSLLVNPVPDWLPNMFSLLIKREEVRSIPLPIDPSWPSGELHPKLCKLVRD